MLTESQHTTYQYIKRYIRDAGYAPTTAEITEGLGLKSRSAVHRNLKAISEAGFISLLPNRRRNIRLNKSVEDDLPALAGSLARDQLITPKPNAEPVNVNELIAGDNRFLLEVEDDSMIGDHICKGDWVICQKVSEAQNGQIAIVLLHGNCADLKRYWKEGDKVTLIPSNPNEPPRTYTCDEVNIQGIYLGVLRLGTLSIRGDKNV